MLTKEEKNLLERMANGELDGYAGSWDAGKSSYTRMIRDGIPITVKEGPGYKFFDGKENEWHDGKRQIYQEWSTDSEKIDFLRKYGWLMKDKAVIEYSAKFKP